jgi:hypothetical protein
MKINATLPSTEVEELRSLRAEGRTRELRLRVLALRAKDWPLRAIGDPLEVSRMSVRNWQLAGEQLQSTDAAFARELTELTEAVPALPAEARGSNLKPRRVYPRIPDPDATRLRELAPEVKKLRGRTAPDSPVRLAVREFDSLLDLYVNQRGVTPMDAARAAGVTRRAVAVHLEKMKDAA